MPTKTHEDWRIAVDDIILNLAVAAVPFTASDVRALMELKNSTRPFDDLLAPNHFSAWGARFRVAQAEGIIKVRGFEPSTQRSRHGAIQRVWIGC